MLCRVLTEDRRNQKWYEEFGRTSLVCVCECESCSVSHLLSAISSARREDGKVDAEEVEEGDTYENRHN